MTFTPDTDTNWQAFTYYVYGNTSADGSAGAVNPPVKLSDHDLNQFLLAFVQWVCTQMTAGATLVNNSATTQAPNGSILTALNLARSMAIGGNRGF